MVTKVKKERNQDMIKWTLLLLLLVGCEATTNLEQNYDGVKVTPMSPSNLVATQENNSMILTWKDNSHNEDGFEIYLKKAVDDDFCKYHITNANDTTRVIYNLSRNYYYIFRVRAYNQYGFSDFAEVKILFKL